MIIQSISVRWTKETRGEPYASIRSQHPTHFPLHKDRIEQVKAMTQELKEPLLWHRSSFGQTKQGIELLHEHYEWLPVSDNILESESEVPGVRWMRIGDKLCVHACYHPSFGKPVRTNGQSELLNEKAFELLPFQYGQIIINGRHTVEDGSVYEQRIMNIWNVADASMILDLTSIPDHQYKQLAALW